MMMLVNRLYYFLKNVYIWVFIKHSPKKIMFEQNIRKVNVFDGINGTDFGGDILCEDLGLDKDRAKGYSPSPRLLIKTIRSFHIDSTQKIVDMGCGKGYAMYLMSSFDFGKVGGVELSPDLYKIAVENLKKVMPDSTNYQLYLADAGQWDGYDEYNIFYIYNSFPEKVMIEVKNNMEESYIRRPRNITVWYLYPNFPEVFENSPKWKLIKRGNILQQRGGMHIFRYTGS